MQEGSPCGEFVVRHFFAAAVRRGCRRPLFAPDSRSHFETELLLDAGICLVSVLFPAQSLETVPADARMLEVAGMRKRRFGVL